jgi:hypothetical protein
VPEIETARSPTIHFDDSVPLEIVNPSGLPASPSMGTYQQDLMAVKLRVKCCWGVLQPGCVQYLTGVNW